MRFSKNIQDMAFLKGSLLKRVNEERTSQSHLHPPVHSLDDGGSQSWAIEASRFRRRIGRKLDQKWRLN